MDALKTRQDVLLNLQEKVRQLYNPRFSMALIMLATLGIIFLGTKALLHWGVTNMSERYLASVAAGYLVFIGLLWIWTHFDWNLNQIESLDVPTNISLPGDGFDIDFGAGAVVLALLAILVAGFLFATSLLVAEAPLLLAELMLDAGVIKVIYSRAINIPREFWIVTAVRRTWLTFAFLAFILGGSGLVAQKYVPCATTLGQAYNFIATCDGDVSCMREICAIRPINEPDFHP